MDPLGLQKALAGLPAEVQAALGPVITQIFDRLGAAESNAAVMVEGLKSAILPEVQAARKSIDAMTQTFNGAVTAVQGIVNRIDGAKLESKLTLGPLPSVGETVVTVQE